MSLKLENMEKPKVVEKEMGMDKKRKKIKRKDEQMSIFWE